MTLMPVSNISSLVDCSSNSGAGGEWHAILSPTGPISSTGSPRTFMMRPRVPSPTGTVIGPPGRSASMPRTMPSVTSWPRSARGPRPDAAHLQHDVDGRGHGKALAGYTQRLIDRRHLASSNCTSTAGPETELLCQYFLPCEQLLAPSFLAPSLPALSRAAYSAISTKELKVRS